MQPVGKVAMPKRTSLAQRTKRQTITFWNLDSQRPKHSKPRQADRLKGQARNMRRHPCTISSWLSGQLKQNRPLTLDFCHWPKNNALVHVTALAPWHVQGTSQERSLCHETPQTGYPKEISLMIRFRPEFQESNCHLWKRIHCSGSRVC